MRFGRVLTLTPCSSPAEVLCCFEALFEIVCGGGGKKDETIIGKHKRVFSYPATSPSVAAQPYWCWPHGDTQGHLEGAQAERGEREIDTHTHYGRHNRGSVQPPKSSLESCQCRWPVITWTLPCALAFAAGRQYQNRGLLCKAVGECIGHATAL